MLIGLESSGLHTNGYSLARKIVHGRLRLGWDDSFRRWMSRWRCPFIGPSILSELSSPGSRSHSCDGAHHGRRTARESHRALNPRVDAVIDPGTWEIPSVFTVLESAGSVERGEMFRAFNMGVGMVVIAAREKAT